MSRIPTYEEIKSQCDFNASSKQEYLRLGGAYYDELGNFIVTVQQNPLWTSDSEAQKFRTKGGREYCIFETKRYNEDTKKNETVNRVIFKYAPYVAQMIDRARFENEESNLSKGK